LTTIKDKRVRLLIALHFFHNRRTIRELPAIKKEKEEEDNSGNKIITRDTTPVEFAFLSRIFR
jgi:hypothetical protein